MGLPRREASTPGVLIVAHRTRFATPEQRAARTGEHTRALGQFAPPRHLYGILAWRECHRWATSGAPNRLPLDGSCSGVQRTEPSGEEAKTADQKKAKAQQSQTEPASNWTERPSSDGKGDDDEHADGKGERRK
jgi:hypothetical protein